MKSIRLFVPAIFAVLLLAPLTFAQQLDVETVSGREVAAREILVKLRPGTSVQQFAQSVDAEMAESIGDSGTIRLKSRSLSAATLVEQTNRSPLVELSEPNYVLHAADTVPDDTKFGDLWGLRNNGQLVMGKAGLPFADIEAVKAWDIQQGSNTILVGVLDTGIDFTHPDLSANIWTATAPFTINIGSRTITCPVGSHGFNLLDFSCNPQDDHTHGTHVAGVIGARGNNASGVTGVNWTTSMVSLKFLNAYGLGTVADAINIFKVANQMWDQGIKMRVLNCGWGSAASSVLLQNAINDANTFPRASLVVAGAGNDRQNNDGPVSFYPASTNAANIIAVAATDNNDKLAHFSNYGLTTVDLGAPGVDIESTIPGGGYSYFSGTSLSTAYVSGAAALILAQCPLFTVSDLKTAILNNVDVIPSLVGKTVTKGRLNVYRSVVYCKGLTAPTFTLSASPLAMEVIAGGPASSTITVTPVGGFAGGVTFTTAVDPAGVGVTAGTPAPVAGGSGTTTLNVTTAASTPAQAFKILVTGTGPSPTQTYTEGLSLTVHRPDFSLTPTPASVSLNPGGSSTVTITVDDLYGFSGTVNLSATGLPVGVSGTFLPASMILAGDSTLTLTALATAAPGIYSFTVTGVSGALTHSVTVNLLITTPDFTISAAPDTLVLEAGDAADSQISVTALNGFSGLVNLTASGMPAGVVASLTPGSVSGGGNSVLTLTTALSAVGGIYPITVKGTSGALVRTTTVNLNVVAPLVITTTTLPVGQAGVFYSATLTATGGVMPYKWTLISGRLPRGLTLDESTGVISGTLNSVLNAPFTFQVRDSGPQPAVPPDPDLRVKTLTLTFTNAGFVITTPSLPSGQIGVFYSQTLTVAGGLGPYTWSIIGGALPAPLLLNAATGQISGTPTGVSTNTLTFQVKDSNFPAQIATKILTLAITPPGLVITTASLAVGHVGLPYSQQMTAVGGVSPYTWKIISGRLPQGMTFDEANGLISGIPTGANAGSSLIFRVTDSTTPFPQTATVNLLLTVKVGP